MSLRKELIRAIKSGDMASIEALRANPEALSLEGETFTDLHIAVLDLSAFELTNTEWESCIFDRVTLQEVNADGAYFNGCTFHGCTLQQISLEGASFDGCIFRRSKLAGLEMSGTEINDTQFQDCVLADIVLDDVNWRSVSFSDGSIHRLNGISGRLASVTLRGVTAEEVDLAALELEHCTTTSPENRIEGFTLRSGRRCRV